MNNDISGGGGGGGGGGFLGEPGAYPEIDGGGCRTDSALRREFFWQPRPLSSID